MREFHIVNEAEYADRLLKHREELRTQVDEIIDRLEEQYQAKNAAVAQLDEQIDEKSSALTQTAAELADKQSLLETSAKKTAKLKSISEIETGKTMFSGKVTLSREDYVALTDLARKQIATESKENELSAEISRLKKENEQAAEQIAAQKQEILRLYPLKEELRKVKNELSSLKLKFQKVMDLFIKSIDFLFLLLDLLLDFCILFVLLNSQAAAGFFGSSNLYSVSRTNLRQNFALCFTPAGNGFLAAAVAHFFESLRYAVSGINTAFVMSDGYVVNMQVRSGFVKVKNSVKHIEIRVAFLKALHILCKTGGSDFSVRSSDSGVLHIADLHHVFIKVPAFIGGGNDGLRDVTLENVTEITR